MAKQSQSRLVEPLPVQPAARTISRETVGWMLIGYLLLVAAGYIFFRMGGASVSGGTPSRVRALFLATNIATLTGMPTSVQLDSTPLATAAFLTLTLAGSLLSLIVGSLAVVRILRLPYSDRNVIQSAIVACGVAVAIGTAALLGSNQPPLQAMLLSASAFGNSGFFLGNLPEMRTWETSLILLPLAVAGGLGLPVLMELLDRLRGRHTLSLHSRTVLAWSAGLYLGGFLLIALLQGIDLQAMPLEDRLVTDLSNDIVESVQKTYPNATISSASARDNRGRTVAFILELVLPDGEKKTVIYDPTGQPLPPPWMDVALSSSVQSVNSRTAGFRFQFAQDLPRTVHWVLMGLMLIGASSAGTGGGLKTTTIATLFRGARRALAGQAPGRPFGIALAWLAMYVLAIGISYLALLCTEIQLPADRLLFETVSAVGNVGLTHETVLVVGPGLVILSLAMLFGRLAPLLILWWMACTTEDADLAVG